MCAALFFRSVWENIGKMRPAKKSYNFKILLHSKINSVLSIDFLPFENLKTMYWFRFHLLELGYFYDLRKKSNWLVREGHKRNGRKKGPLSSPELFALSMN